MKNTVMLAVALASPVAYAGPDITMNMVSEKGVGTSIGTVAVSDSKHGLVLTPSLRGLKPGVYGFHVHQNPSCDPKEKDGKMVAALGAGGHLDPAGANKHGAPWGDGHLGDLPALYVDSDGNASQPVLAPRLKTADLAGRSLMIHAGGDNYSDNPAPLGGGGARMACGVVK
ncbi:superoxide dismutase family protein [Noviherbaspirillum agri]